MNAKKSLEMLRIALFLTLLLAAAAIPCDDVYGSHCPEASSWAVQDCIKEKVDPSLLDQSCIDYMRVHDACRNDINKLCSGMAYTADLLPCLTEWTTPDKLDADCVASFPKKKEKKTKTLTDEQKKKADKRRKTRNKAAKMAKDTL